VQQNDQGAIRRAGGDDVQLDAVDLQPQALGTCHAMIR
jgi:hypothetical protein